MLSTYFWQERRLRLLKTLGRAADSSPGDASLATLHLGPQEATSLLFTSQQVGWGATCGLAVPTSESLPTGLSCDPGYSEIRGPQCP